MDAVYIFLYTYKNLSPFVWGQKSPTSYFAPRLYTRKKKKKNKKNGIKYFTLPTRKRREDEALEIDSGVCKRRPGCSRWPRIKRFKSFIGPYCLLDDQSDKRWSPSSKQTEPSFSRRFSCTNCDDRGGGAMLSRKNCDDSRGSRNAVEYREIDGFVEGQGWSSRSLEEKLSSFLSSSDIAQSPRFILAYMSHPKHASIHYSESSNLSEIGRVKKWRRIVRDPSRPLLCGRWGMYFFFLLVAK